MAMNRIDALTSLLEQNPADTFARYALAMEYVKDGRDVDAVREFLVKWEQQLARGSLKGGEK